MNAGRGPLPDGGSLAYQRDGEGAGPPLLLIRPLTGSMAQWGRFRELLAAERPVISFDARGVGRSSRVRLPTTTRRMAGDAVALLDHLEVDRADVFGLSLGGMVATWLAIDAPTRVRRLVLASTLPLGRATGVTETLRGARRGFALARCFVRGEHHAAACLARRILSRRFRDACPEEAARIEAAITAEGLSRTATLAHLAAAAGHDARSRLGDIAAPTLVIRGGIDVLVREDALRDLVEGIRDARAAVIADAGHSVDLEAPDRCAALVASFVA